MAATVVTRGGNTGGYAEIEGFFARSLCELRVWETTGVTRALLFVVKEGAAATVGASVRRLGGVFSLRTIGAEVPVATVAAGVCEVASSGVVR